MRLILHFHCSWQIAFASIRWCTHLNYSSSPYTALFYNAMVWYLAPLSLWAFILIVAVPCCSHVVWYFVAWICPAEQWDDNCCLVCRCHVNLLTHCPRHLTKSWITLVRFGCCPVCLCLNFYHVHCPPGSCIRWFWLRCLSSSRECLQPLSLPPCQIMVWDGTRTDSV